MVIKRRSIRTISPRSPMRSKDADLLPSSKFAPYTLQRGAAAAGTASKAPPPGVPTRYPSHYNPRLRIADEYWRYDPQPEACRLYVAQAEQLAQKKQLVTFDLGLESYVPWKCAFMGLQKLNTAVKNGIRLEPAFCHHSMNRKRDPGWSQMSVYKRHPCDPNLDVVGYMSPATHVCVAQPIYSCKERLAASQPLVAQYRQVSEDEDEVEFVSVPVYRGENFGAQDGEQVPTQALDGALVHANSHVTFATDQFVYLQKDIKLYWKYAEDVDVGDGTFLQTQQQKLWEKLPSASSGPVLDPSQSRYDATKAETRKLTDAVVTESILEAAALGQYMETPTSHPAFSVDDPASTPACLRLFQKPGVEHLASARTGPSEFSAVGAAILQLNGLRGLSLTEFSNLRRHTIKCLSCLCYFSFEGYQRHINFVMRCQNTPALERAPDLARVFDGLEPLRIQTFPFDGTQRHHESLTSALGLAWMTWNSPAGVTHDVWVHLITAWRACPSHCGRVRTYKAHLEHLSLDAHCAELGDTDAGVPPTLEEDDDTQ
ncbi:hypothetical protein F5878DRAFT_602525 [Lentinula raphanica]|uniref:Uncharacterized protein n=1 Tax=Lentinula raphanica TaxID=153919 RepID=A0AA38UK54_9AGAR|nr:hypothetical protein F5878DRAFT_602525 [Lentinula raphanica]